MRRGMTCVPNPEARPFLAASIPNLYRPFHARQFADPAVAWVNERYWVEREVDVTRDEVRQQLDDWLLDNFAVSVPSPDDPERIFRDTWRELHADRYGGPNGSMHGGAGRAAAAGSFYAKGVGRTPLCSGDVEWYHSNGYMWMEEAIREAVFAELSWHEFPLRSNPVAAIIDPGVSNYRADGTYGDRRAVVVRPAVMRVSHLERSIYFGTAGTPASDQYRDAERVREALREVAFGTEAVPHEPAGFARRMLGLAENAGRQIGFGHAHRLSHGDYFSSNLCFSGALLDFGTFRALPNWRQAFCVASSPPFGQEMSNLAGSFRAIHFYARKYLPPEESFDPKLAEARLRRTAADAIDAEIRRPLAGLTQSEPSLAERAAALLLDEFERQQKVQESYLEGQPEAGASTWIHSSLKKGAARDGCTDAERTGAALYALTEPDGARSWAAAVDRRIARLRLLRWSRPRRAAVRETLLKRISLELLAMDLQPNQGMGPGPKARTARLIDRIVSISRRVFEEDEGCVTVGHAMRGSASITVFRDHRSRRLRCRVEGTAANGSVVIFGRRFDAGTFASIEEDGPASRVRVETDVDPAGWPLIPIGGTRVEAPAWLHRLVPEPVS